MAQVTLLNISTEQLEAIADIADVVPAVALAYLRELMAEVVTDDPSVLGDIVALRFQRDIQRREAEEVKP